jgi:tetratricopeptide (TPR) repeat protein
MRKLVLGLGLTVWVASCSPADVLRNQGSSLTSTDYVGDAVRKQQAESEARSRQEAAQRDDLNRRVASAQAHVDLFEYKEAIVDWKDAYRISNDPIYLLRLAESDRALGDCPEAQQMYQQYLDKKPGAPDAEQVKNRLAETKTCQTRAAGNGDTIRKHNQAAVTHYELSEYDAAIKDFKEAYRLSNDPAYLFNIAQSYRLLRKCTDAMQFYQRYLSAAGDIPNKDKVQARIDEMRACAK